jgi:hypothetical membrane protein
MGSLKLPLATIGGALVIVLFCAFTLASAVRYPGPFSPMDNWLSDLGTATKNPAGNIYFNVGCILTGISTLFVVAGMNAWRTERDKLLLAASRIFGTASAFALMLIGAFDENTPYHTILSIMFFLSLTFFMVLTNVALWKHPAYEKWIGYYAAVAVAIGVAFGFTFFAYEHAPVWEWMAAFSALLWVALFSYNMLKLESKTAS